MQIPIESREVDEEGQWRRQSAKETVQQITENVLPMSHLQTPITVQEASHCTLSRWTLQEDSRQVKFSRISLHRKTTCANKAQLLEWYVWGLPTWPNVLQGSGSSRPFMGISIFHTVSVLQLYSPSGWYSSRLLRKICEHSVPYADE